MIQTLTLYIVAASAALFCIIYAFVILFRGLLGREAPFIRSPWTAVNVLENFFSLGKNSVFYDLGCGDGRVLRAFRDRYPLATYVGVEKNLIPYLFFQIRNARVMSNRFTVIRENIFNLDLSNATHIFVYLFPAMMPKLERKLSAELKNGTKVVSLDYPFNDRQSKETLKFFDRNGMERLFYIYEF